MLGQGHSSPGRQEGSLWCSSAAGLEVLRCGLFHVLAIWDERPAQQQTYQRAKLTPQAAVVLLILHNVNIAQPVPQHSVRGTLVSTCR
jgi:hypothetical protein